MSCKHNLPSKTSYVAMDCEMVGIGPEGKDSMVARVSIVNHLGKCIYDKYVKPEHEVTDYRTAVSGICPFHLKKGKKFSDVQKEVQSILDGKILVGHALNNDLCVLSINHPRSKIRDTAYYRVFYKLFDNQRPSLKKLAQHFLKKDIQSGEHSSVEDARCAMQIFLMHRCKWEESPKLRKNSSYKPKNKKPAKDDKAAAKV